MAANGEVVDVDLDKETSGIMDETSGEGEPQQTILSLESILSIVWYFYYYGYSYSNLGTGVYKWSCSCYFNKYSPK